MRIDVPAIVALVVWILVTIVTTLGSIVVYINLFLHDQSVLKYRKRDSSIPDDDQLAALPGVTILRPLKGIDNSLVDNLASSFRQRYAKFEIILSVADEDDPAIDVVRALQQGAYDVGVNPKVNNLVRGYESSKYDVIWILDSNVYTSEHCLARSIIKLVSDPAIVRPESFGSMLELTFLNTAHAKMYSAINFTRASSCIVGKSNIFYKKSLQRVGGFRNFGHNLSEDNIIGQSIWDEGLRHCMTTDLAYQPLGALSVAGYFKRRSRWIRVRKYAVPLATISEPFSESLICCAVGAYSLSRLFGLNPTMVYFAHLLFWMASDFTIATVLNPWPISKFHLYTAAWIVRELSALHVFLYAVAGSTVEWRDAIYKLRSDGTVLPTSESSKYTWSESLNPMSWFTRLSYAMRRKSE